jgi:hypothetical protein
MVGGTAEGVLALSYIYATAGIGALAGGCAMYTHAADNMSAGWDSMVGGKPAQTRTSAAVQDGLMALGVPSGTANYWGEIANATIGMGGSMYLGKSLALAKGGQATLGEGLLQGGDDLKVPVIRTDRPATAVEASVLDDAGTHTTGVRGSSANPIQGLELTGSALKTDPAHAFPDLVDNFAGDAQRFLSPTKGPGGAIVRQSELFQLEGSMMLKEKQTSGVFEWIVDQGKVTHRMFRPGGSATGNVGGL